MLTVETLDGPIELEASDALFLDIHDALSFHYAYGRHPYRSLGGIRTFMITTDDFRYVDSPRWWRFTLEQTKTMFVALWPEEGHEVLARFGRDYGARERDYAFSF